MAYKNKEDMADYGHKWYLKNIDKRKKQIAERRIKIMEWFKEYKKTLKCGRCPESDSVCLDFHHFEDKNENVSKMVVNGVSIKKIKEEITKCKILCSNCHRKEHKGL